MRRVETEGALTLPLSVPAEAAGFFEGRLLADAQATGFFHQKNLEVPQAKPGRV